MAVRPRFCLPPHCALTLRLHGRGWQRRGVRWRQVGLGGQGLPRGRWLPLFPSLAPARPPALGASSLPWWTGTGLLGTPKAGGTRGHPVPGVDAVGPGELAKPLGPWPICLVPRRTPLPLPPAFESSAVGTSWFGGKRRSPLQTLYDLDQVGEPPSRLLPPATVAGARVDLLSRGCGHLGLRPESECWVVTGQTLGAGRKTWGRPAIHLPTQPSRGGLCWALGSSVARGGHNEQPAVGHPQQEGRKGEPRLSAAGSGKTGQACPPPVPSLRATRCSQGVLTERTGPAHTCPCRCPQHY